HGDNPAVLNAQTVEVSPTTTLRADATGGGEGGHLVVWSEAATRFAGSASAAGGTRGGDGGFVEVSSAGDLTYGGQANTAAPRGRTGTLLLDPKNLVISSVTGMYPYFELVNPSPNAGDNFGQDVQVLSGGNLVVTAPGNDTMAA